MVKVTAFAVLLLFGFRLTKLFFWTLLQITLGPQREPLGIDGAKFLQARCPSRFRTNSVQPLTCCTASYVTLNQQHFTVWKVAAWQHEKDTQCNQYVVQILLS